MKLWHVIAVAFFAASWAFAETGDAKGVVYNDKNGNALRDAGERGLPGVLVSNGMDIVKTDKKGAYSLPVSDDTVIFLIKPDGWRVPAAQGNTAPRFYYIHKPGGSPAMKYPGIAPTGPLPGSIDFPLQRRREPKEFRMICFGDTQTRNVEEIQFLAHDILEDVRGLDAAFGVTLGDNVFNDLNVFDPLAETMTGTGIPWRYVPGNHDHNHDAPDANATDDSFVRAMGPAYYSFNQGRVHFIILDDIRQEIGREDYHGGLGERQLAFVKNDLAHVDRGQLVVLLMHIPVMGIDEARELYALLNPFPHTFSISGHTHDQSHVFIKSGGWPQETPHHHLIHATACGSWWGGNFDDNGIPSAQMSDGTPNGYSIITFNGVKYDVEFRVARRPAEYQMNVWVPEEIPAAETGKADVIVNVFAGSEKSVVEMSVDGVDGWEPMERFHGKDPYYVRAAGRQAAFIALTAELKGEKEPGKSFINEMRAKFKPVLRGLPEPSDSTHLWKAALPEGLKPGAHSLTVREKDMFGRTHTATRIFVVK